MNTLSLADTLIIRPMRQEDLEQVQAIDQASFSMPWPTSSFNYELNENPLSLLLVAEINQPQGQPLLIGMIVLWLILDEAHIATFAIHPDYRGQGIAKRLLVEALIEAIQRGSQQATLEVRISNTIAQKLYYRFGFEIAGRRSRYYRDNFEDALILTVGDLGDGYLAWLEQEGWKTSMRPVSPPG